jgi:hypothetical protein
MTQPATETESPIVQPGGFTALGLLPELLEVLTALGYEEPTPIQRESIPPLLAVDAGDEAAAAEFAAEFERAAAADEVAPRDGRLLAHEEAPEEDTPALEQLAHDELDRRGRRSRRHGARRNRRCGAWHRGAAGAVPGTVAH